MKKNFFNFFAIAITAILLQSFYSLCYSQNSIGFTGGINISKAIYEYSGTDWAFNEPKSESVVKPYLGFRIESLFGNHEIIKGMFQTGLFVSFIGSEDTYSHYYQEDSILSRISSEYYEKGYNDVAVETVDVNGILNLIYIEVPFHFGAHYKGIKVFVGPYFRFGVYGDYKREIIYHVQADDDWINNLPEIDETRTQSDKLKVQFEASRVEIAGYDENKIYYKIFDFGLDYGIGYQYKSLLLSVQISSGLSNIVAEVEDQIDPDFVSQRNKAFNVSLTVLF